MKQKKFGATNWKDYLPIPVCEDCPEYEDFYFKAWEIAHDHIKYIDGMPQNPYMDEAFCKLQIWIWDTCFMTLFCKYAQNVFPGIESFKNFYEVLYDGKKLPQLIPDEDEPAWAYKEAGVPNPIQVHIADNPPLFAWAEYENALVSGDLDHIRELLYDKQYLQKHYEWLENLKEKTTPDGVCICTCLISEDLGYRWEGGRSGMDNTPRGRKMVHQPTDRPNNPDMLWIDAICQMALFANTMAKLYKLLGDEQNALTWQEKYESKKQIVEKYYWDNKDSFYYDIDVNTHDFHKVMTIASFWTLTAEIANKERAEILLTHITNPDTFGGELPLVSLSRNDGDFYDDGRYWRGGFWLPTAYAALRGFTNYGYHKEVQSSAQKILDYMLKTYNDYEPHTIWEAYAPTGHVPADFPSGDEPCNKDFCGWSALGPISVYIEYVLGFHTINAFEKTVEWAKPSCFDGEIGIKNLRFGDVITDIVFKDGVCEVVSNNDYILKIDGKPFQIKQGAQAFTL